jgi:adenylate cyclase
MRTTPAHGSDVSESAILGVLFVDIADSTRLYRTLGDERARVVVLDWLARLSGVVTGLGGRVVDSIGDELLCAFDSPQETVAAAVALQQATAQPGREAQPDAAINVRIGVEIGPVVRGGRRVFGKTVYTAKRVATLAKPRQVLTTASTKARLDPHLVALRFVDRVVLKGSRGPTDVFEILWDPQAATDRRLHSEAIAAKAELWLFHAGRELVIDENHAAITIGRGESRDLVIPDRDVSWLHAKIECPKGRPTLTDVSTNGTFVLPDGAPASIRVHWDTVALAGGGLLGLGRPPVPEDKSSVTFACRIVP